MFARGIKTDTSSKYVLVQYPRNTILAVAELSFPQNSKRTRIRVALVLCNYIRRILLHPSFLQKIMENILCAYI